MGCRDQPPPYSCMKQGVADDQEPRYVWLIRALRARQLYYAMLCYAELCYALKAAAAVRSEQCKQPSPQNKQGQLASGAWGAHSRVHRCAGLRTII